MQTPYNALTGTLYSGKNIDTLLRAMAAGGYTDPQFVTFRQALKLGRCVCKGQKAAARIVKVVTGTKTVETAEGKDKRRAVGLRSYSVFNLAQTAPLADAS
ncbi:hypothetical protein LCGC14_1035050 [marine sediment metagenome]|uniref:N-terminal domain-containing protein n=1 Tax=marine sediment metagenome TaxID=412755 RepID=A0A0F9QZJ0_9ZZZZ